MDHKEAHHLRLYVLAALFFIVAAVYIGVLYDTQVNNYDYYYASSVRSIARSETVEAARGNITDRNGKVLVSSRSSYNLTFDASLLEKDEDANESLLRLLQLCQSRGINWVDSLPISRSAPFAYTIDSLDSAARSRFLTYLKDLVEAALDLGCTPMQAFTKVVIHEIMPGIISGALMAFTMSLDDFVISYFVTGSSFITLPVEIYNYTKKPIQPKIYALFTLMFIVILVLMVVMNLLQAKSEKNRQQPRRARA